MDDGDLTGVDDGFAVEAHQVDVLDVLAEAVHVLQVGENGVEALHACCAGCNDHLLTGAHQLDAGAGDVGLQVLGVVAAGQCDAEQALIALADLQSVHDAAGRLQSGDDEDFALTRYLTAHGVVVSIGHSGATYEQAVMAYANGARSMTHVYNGMTPFNHRANGLVGAAYRIRTMYGEIICDGCHSTPAALNNYFMSKGPDYAIMISDALMAKGTPVGSKYIFGGNEIVIYPDGSAHLTSTGGLAGSTLNINKGLKILVEDAMVPFNYALNACTINPARCLHLDDRKGSIQVGKDADLVVLEDNYDVLQTYCMGQAKL